MRSWNRVLSLNGRARSTGRHAQFGRSSRSSSGSERPSPQTRRTLCHLRSPDRTVVDVKLRAPRLRSVVYTVTLLNESKDNLDSGKWLTGTGSNEPGGILNIGGTGALTTTQRVQTNTTAVTAIGDVYLL